MECNKVIEQLATEDDMLASLAMKDLLARPDIGEVVAAYMDAPNPLLRKRMHQIATIADRRQRAMRDFRSFLLDNKTSLWELAIIINCMLDRQTSAEQICSVFMRYIESPGETVKSVTGFAKLISDLGLHTIDAPQHYFTDLLVNDVMLNNCGDECAVALVASRLGAVLGWPLTIGFYRNAIALRDRMFNVVIPANGWGVTHALTKEFLPLDKHSFIIYYLGMLRNAATIDQLPLIMAKIDYLIHTAIALKK